ncbi:hypothetical protein F750_3225 [Streptomyces sp. PAMC 26508]|nr:hypothetical protein F750_3225 [Streptomyces sp. PAMC 26508]
MISPPVLSLRTGRTMFADRRTIFDPVQSGWKHPGAAVP